MSEDEIVEDAAQARYAQDDDEALRKKMGWSR